MGSLEKRLACLEVLIPPPSPPYDELPVAEWVAEMMADPPDCYLQNNNDEEPFYD
jgi:hypothetical protein